jgi:hypothetical protein
MESSAESKKKARLELSKEREAPKLFSFKKNQKNPQ